MKYTIEPGIYAATLTPLHEDLQCNIPELFFHCSDLLSRGCKGIVLFGTTGEGPSFSVPEKIAALKQLVAEGIDPRKILLANGGASILETVVLAQAAIELGCVALLVVPPSFYKNVPEEGVIAYYREIVQRVGSPALQVLLYHIPQYSGVPITKKIIQVLRDEFPRTVIGIKESEGNLSLSLEWIQAFPGFQVFVGNEGHILKTVQQGGAGSICGIANLYPEVICQLYKGSEDKKVDLLFEALKGLSFISAAKSVMEKRRGEGWHRVRPPLLSLNGTETIDFHAKLEKIGLENASE